MKTKTVQHPRVNRKSRKWLELRRLPPIIWVLCGVSARAGDRLRTHSLAVDSAHSAERDNSRLGLAKYGRENKKEMCLINMIYFIRQRRCGGIFFKVTNIL